MAWAALAQLAAPGVAPAQTDPSGAWHTWRTEHFRVHAKLEQRDAAVAAAREAERAYGLLVRELRPPRGIVDLTLLDNTDFSNGAASIIPSNRLVVFLTPPGPDVSLGVYDAWLRVVLTHELAHLFHLDRADGVWGVLQQVFGRAPGLFPNTYQPSWVSEGLATYYESRLTHGGRVRGAFHTQLLRAAAAGGRWPGANDATLTLSAWPAGTRPYAWGSRFFALQAATYGDSVVPRFVDRSSGQWWPLATSRPLHGAGGVSVDAGWRRLWERADADGAPAADSVVLVRGLFVEPQLTLAPDGSRLAYVRHDGRSVGRVEIRGATDGRVLAHRRLTGGAEIAWVADTLYVTQLDFGSPVEIWSDLYRWVPGRSWTRLTRRARFTTPFATRDRSVGVLTSRGGTRSVVALQGPMSRPRSFPAPPADEWANLAVSPDGRWVAGVRHHGGRFDVVVWPREDPDQVVSVTDDLALEADPAWSPDGARLLFVSERSGLPQIYEYDLAMGRLRRRTDVSTGAREPQEAPDGTLYHSTLLADGFAIVRQPAAPPVLLNAPPTPPAPLFEPAPAVPVTEGGYDPWPALRPRYWIPVGRDEGSAGFFVGALTSGVDPIGRTSYGVTALVAPDRGRWEAGLSVEHRRWKAASVDVGLSQTWDPTFGVTSDGTVVTLAERERRLTAGLTLRWRRWRTGVSLRMGGELEGSALAVDDTLQVGVPSLPVFAGGVVAARVAHASRPLLAIAPENGVVLDGRVSRRWAVAGDGWSYGVRGAVTGYLALPLPGFAHWVLAVRVSGAQNGGPTPQRFSVGGESGDLFEIVPGYAVGAGRRAFPLRGYPRHGAFTRAFVGAAELRIPLVLASIGIWKLPVVLDRISLSAFAELGGGWRQGDPAVPTALRDVGAEVVFDLGVSYDVPLQVRLGGAVPLTDGAGVSRGDARMYIAFGPAF